MNIANIMEFYASMVKVVNFMLVLIFTTIKKYDAGLK